MHFMKGLSSVIANPRCWVMSLPGLDCNCQREIGLIGPWKLGSKLLWDPLKTPSLILGWTYSALQLPSAHAADKGQIPGKYQLPLSNQYKTLRNYCVCFLFSSSKHLSMLYSPARWWMSSHSSIRALRSLRSWSVQTLWLLLTIWGGLLR